MLGPSQIAARSGIQAVQAGAGWDVMRLAYDATDESVHPRFVDYVAAQLGMTPDVVMQHLVVQSDAKSKTARDPWDDERDDLEWVPFPTKMLPEPMRSYVEQAAPATGGNETNLALHLLALLSSCVGTTRMARIKDDWREPAALWCVVISNSGQNKTPQFNEVVGLLRDHVKRANKEYDDAKADYRARMQEARANRKSGESPEDVEEPIHKRYMIDDATLEAAARTLQGNPRGVLLACDELAGWFKSFGAYKGGKGSDKEHWMRLKNASNLTIDRKGGGIDGRTTYIPRAMIAVTGGIQPEPMRLAISKEDIENGLLARFILANPPDKLVEWNEAVVNPACRNAVKGVVAWLLGLNHDANGDPCDVTFSPEAMKLWVNHVNEIGRMNAAEPSNCVRAMCSKLKGDAARIALVLHLARAGSGDSVERDEIDDWTMRCALEITWWAIRENKRVYERMGWAASRVETLDAKVINVLRSAPAAGLGMGLKDVHRATNNKHKGAELREALARLVAAGDAVVKMEQSPGAKKPSEKWAVVLAK